MESLRYPIGRFAVNGEITGEQRNAWIAQITGLPAELRIAVEDLNEEQLDTPYREGGWTVRQVVHHLADSHMNSFTRFKLALTEERPTIKPYDEAGWADLPDSKSAPAGLSLALLDVLHERWAILLSGMGEEDFARAFRHPESGIVTLDRAAGLYAWHGRHHVAHITSLRERLGWT
ncbi:YfiT family bacillithiol transferase [Paenibacillus sp. MBLB4367]|uniref:YfiT family bacillithiol transferase n=1 Tax=Paenibacillus sp. MBLB4367 TaxID=3384767 RepID=UPI0039080AE0